MKRWFLPLLTACIVLLAGWLFYQMAWTASRGGVESPLYSAERYDPYGVAALYRLLQKQGLAVHRLQRPYLSKEDAGVLIQLVPSTDAFDEIIQQTLAEKSDSLSADDEDQTADKQEQVEPSENTSDKSHKPSGQSLRAAGVNPYALSEAEILEWVSQGNMLVQMSHSRTRIMDLAGVPLTHATQGAFSGYMVEELQRSGATPDLLPQPVEAQWTREAKRLYELRGRGPLLHSPLVFTQEGGRTGWTPLLKVGDEVVAGQMRYGRGRIVVIGAPTPALNQMIGQGGNLPLMLKMVGNGPVIFDSWSHEPGQAGSLMGLLREFGLLPLLLQLVLLMLVYHWSTQGRRRTLPLEADRPRSSVEQILTLGYLYDQAMEPSVAAMRTVREVRHRVAKGLSCSAEKIARRLEQGDLDPARVKQARELLAAADALTKLWPSCCNHCGHDFKETPATHCPRCRQLISPQPTTASKGVSPHATGESLVTESDIHKTPAREVPTMRNLVGDLSRLLTLSHEFATGKKS